jgi:hypothetical protein
MRRITVRSDDRIHLPEQYFSLLESQRVALAEWIRLAVKPAKTPDPHMQSYGLKNDAERDLHFYVSNGAMKGAMLAAGYKAVGLYNLTCRFYARPTRKRWAAELSPKFHVPEGHGQSHRRYAVSHLPPEQLQHLEVLIEAAVRDFDAFLERMKREVTSDAKS